ncbi:GNAT family N-acetyltransferase [Neptunitalea lumnitzerae]|nr:GNAT family N-acetyltransferase [Neptunitalea sp. Y10]
MEHIKIISAEETIVVRHPVLREGKPVDSCVFAGDELETTVHLGYFQSDNLLGVVTLLEKNFDTYQGNGIQLRGMAVMPNQQGKGIGGKLVVQAEQAMQKKNAAYIWMNARLIAVPFYEKLGYQTVSSLFDIPLVGPHYTMLKKLAKLEDI